MEINGFEAHDVELGLESLSAIGFGINNFLVECRSGEDWDMPGNPNQVNANGFKWYDTNQEHIITTATFKNCGARRSDNVYDSSSTRGCSTNSVNGCTSSSSVWSFVVSICFVYCHLSLVHFTLVSFLSCARLRLSTNKYFTALSLS